MIGNFLTIYVKRRINDVDICYLPGLYPGQVSNNKFCGKFKHVNLLLF